MNIIIIGPGTDPTRWGTYFVNRAESDGHKVYKFSYRLDANTSVEVVERKFEEFLQTIDKVDLFFYNSMGGFYPGTPSEYTTGHKVDYSAWTQGIMINGAVPHMMAVKVLEKMNDSSRMAFFTSGGSYFIERDNYLSLAGYFGTKGVMNQLMVALAHNNDKKAVACCFSPHFPYEDPEMAKKVMNSLYDRILNISKKDNGKILQCFPPNADIHYFEGRNL